MVSTLVSSTWLRQQITNGLKQIRILDASWHMDNQRHARKEYLKERIDGASFFDIDEVSDQTSPYSHMLPSAEEFTNHVQQLGVSADNHVIVYDNNEQHGFFSAPRVWWMFRAFGHNSVSVLDGGLPRWKFRGFPVHSGLPGEVILGNFKATPNPDLLRTFEQMKEVLSTKSSQVVDARSKGRYEGTEPEPRAGLASGHMVGSSNLPFKDLFNPDSKIMKSRHELQEVFDTAGINMDEPLVATCGSGITAAIIAMAAHIACNKDVPVYDGSWMEWVQRADDNTMVKSITAD